MYKFRRELLYKREKRRTRRHKIWAVLRYMVTYKDFLESKDFYSFKNNLSFFENAKKELNNSSPDDYTFRAAIRFCRIEFIYGRCNHSLTDNDVQTILNWQTVTIDTHAILERVLINYKEYWDDVLASYIRPSARIKRLQYLVEKLEDVSKQPYLQEYPDLIHGVKNLKEWYLTQLP